LVPAATAPITTIRLRSLLMGLLLASETFPG